MASSQTGHVVPLCVDLDGTLIRTDMLLETLARSVKRQPWLMLAAPFWLMQGRATLKRHLAERGSFDPSSLPYNTVLIEFLKAERAGGRKLVLATASDLFVAERIASHVNLFDEVIASNPDENLKGAAKARALSQRYPEGFDYAGDSRADLPVWAQARRSILVNSAANMESDVRRVSQIECVLRSPQDSVWKRLAASLRIHQWAKNLLVFVPAITSHRIVDPATLTVAALTFLAFCLCASSVYIANDIADLEADRNHATKRTRPLATGALPLRAGFALVPGLIVLAAIVMAFIPASAAAVIILYFVASWAYSLYLKRVVLLDVFSLSGLYTLRLAAGHFATGIPFSPWLLPFAVFVFLSLAFNKRVSELQNLRRAGGHAALGRGYSADDMEQINIFGVCSGFLATLIFSLYVNSEAVRALYKHPQILWLICPVFLYWICRIWILSSRGSMNEDPIVFAVRDRVTYGVVLTTAAIMLVSTRDWPLLSSLGLK